MRRNERGQFKLKIVLTVFLLSCFMLIVTTPLHEAAHWVMSDIDPYVEPVEFHIFDEHSFKKGEHILSSALGYVVIEEAYPGAFNDRPVWADLFQEFICIFIQMALTCMIILKILSIKIDKKPKLPNVIKLNLKIEKNKLFIKTPQL
jgi:hypothetical protein